MLTENDVNAAPLTSMLFWTCTTAGARPPGGIPVPVRLTVCPPKPVEASSKTSSVPVRVPLAVGANVTWMVQLAFTARVEGWMGQLFVSAKSPELWPNRPMLETLIGAVPVLVRVALWDPLLVPTIWFPKVSELGASVAGPEFAAPLRLTACGLFGALSANVKVPKNMPAAGAVNVTLIAQLAPTASELPQLFVWPKGLLTAILEMAIAAFPVFWSVTV